MDEYDFLFKIILIGETGVGKSSIVTSYVDRHISDSHETTIGVDFRMKLVEMNGKTAKLQLWDTAGQEKFRAITRSYYRGAHAILVVIDVTNINSFNNINKWFTEIEENCQKKPAVFIIGNKTDLAFNREVMYSDVLEFAYKKEIPYKECSAKTSTFIDDMFLFIAEKTYENCKEQNTLYVNNGIKLDKKEKNSKCCN